MSYGVTLMHRWRAEALPWKDLGPYLVRAQAGDQGALEVVLVSSAPLILKPAVKVYKQHNGATDFDDCVAEAVMILQEAVKSFNPEKSAWSTWLLRLMQELGLKVRTLRRAIYIPQHADARNVRSYFEQVEYAKKLPTVKPLELRTKSDAAEEYHDNRAFVRDPMPGNIDAMDARATIPKFLNGLSKRERMIVCTRYGIGVAQKTLAELARSMGISREQLRYAEVRILRKISEHSCPPNHPRTA